MKVHTLKSLYTEVDCRVENGANSGGHLEYVRDALANLIASPPDDLDSEPKPSASNHTEDLSLVWDGIKSTDLGGYGPANRADSLAALARVELALSEARRDQRWWAERAEAEKTGRYTAERELSVSQEQTRFFSGKVEAMAVPFADAQARVEDLAAGGQPKSDGGEQR